MQHDEYIFPSALDVQPLTRQFSTMMKEILMLANSIYSPLFNNQSMHSIQIIIIIINIVTSFIT